MTSQDSFWKTFGSAVGFEIQEKTAVSGASGEEHELEAIGVDDRSKRLLLLSRELDPRVAALIHSDVASAHGEYRVITARPNVIDLQKLASLVASHFDKTEFTWTEIAEGMGAFAPPKKRGRPPKLTSEERQAQALKQLDATGLAPLVLPFINAVSLSNLGFFEQVLHLIRQAALMDWNVALHNQGSAEGEKAISFRPLLEADTQKWDRQFGVCAVPLYQFMEADWEIFRSGRDIDAAADRLRELGIWQYFYPPSDQAAMAVIDRGLNTESEAAAAVKQLPKLGHPLSSPEIIDISNSNVLEIIDELQARNFIVNGEYGLEVTADGQSLRSMVKFQPREGVIFKLFRLLHIRLGPDGLTIGRNKAERVNR